MRRATLISLTVLGISYAAIKTGPEPGAKVPAFSLHDQNGKERNLASVAGPKGTMLVFIRSADW